MISEASFFRPPAHCCLAR